MQKVHEALKDAFRQCSAEMSRPEAIAQAVQSAISSGGISAHDRLPSVRSLADLLDVSASSVSLAYNMLRDRNVLRGAVGRGTYISAPPDRTPAATLAPEQGRIQPPWRRRTVLASAERLLRSYPEALDCSRGKPDTSLLLADIVARSIAKAGRDTTADRLQYGNTAPIAKLSEALWPRLIRDKIPIGDASMVVGSSAQQLMTMSLLVASRLTPNRPRIVAVEEPGYQTVFDAFEYMGFKLVGVATDEQGAVPASLEAALSQGAVAALFTPCVVNPKGVSWTPERRAALEQVLDGYPQVTAIEDDLFADLANTRPGSMLNGPVSNRTVYIRTFAKSIAPDIRVAVAVAHPRLAGMLAETKSLLDGWTSYTSQRVLAEVLAEPGLDAALLHAKNAYKRRRDAVIATLGAELTGTRTRISGSDGVNVWIQLPRDVRANDVVNRAAEMGVLVASGEPFYIHPGHNDVIRLSVSGITDDEAPLAAHRLAEAIKSSNFGPVDEAIPI